MKFIIYNPKTELFNFFVDALTNELNNKKIEVINYNLNYLNFNYTKDIIIILINPHFIFYYKNIKNEINKIFNKFKYKILYLSEPLNYIIERKVYLELIKIIKPYCLWTYTFDNLNKLNTYLNIFKICPKYNETYILSDINNIKSRNINNIIFFGNINNNRLNTCNSFNKYLINKIESWSRKEWADILNNNLSLLFNIF